jgi:hypothetical protein
MALSGDTVTYAKAVQEIKDYLMIHDKLKDSLDQNLPNPTPGSNMEKMKQFFQSDKLSFAFKKEQIEELFTTYTDSNAIRIYLGTKLRWSYTGAYFGYSCMCCCTGFK